MFFNFGPTFFYFSTFQQMINLKIYKKKSKQKIKKSKLYEKYAEQKFRKKGEIHLCNAIWFNWGYGPQVQRPFEKYSTLQALKLMPINHTKLVWCNKLWKITTQKGFMHGWKFPKFGNEAWGE